MKIEKDVPLPISHAKERAVELAALWIKGLSQKEMAHEYGCSLSLVQSTRTNYSYLFPPREKRSINKGKILAAKILSGEIKIEDPPRDVPIPEGATHMPWNELQKGQCQWSLEGFFVKASNSFPCCGLPTEDKKPFCNHHLKYAKKGWK